MTKIRTLEEADLPGVVSLVQRAGFPHRSAEGWRWALFGNPEQGDLPAGLCAVRGGELVSMIGLQARTFLVDGKQVQAVSGHTFISAPEGRGAGFRLARRALALPGLTAIYSLNNNALAGMFHKRIGLGAWLGPDGRERFEWPVRPLTMTIGLVLSRLARHEPFYDRLSRRERFAQPNRRLEDHDACDDRVRMLDPSDSGDAALIDSFGHAAAKAERASPLRTADIYRFQMADPDAPGRTALLAAFSGDRIDGLCQLILSKPNAFEPLELVATDLVLHPEADRAASLSALVRSARTLARRSGAARLRLPFTARFSKDDFADAPRPIRRQSRYDSAHGFFASGGHALQEHWVPTGYESDFFFALRIPPSAHARGAGSERR